jgi:hypothetical protein
LNIPKPLPYCLTPNSLCFKFRRPRGVFCHTSVNCHRNSYCDNGFCMCKFGFVPVDSMCLPMARSLVDDQRGSLSQPQIYPQKTRNHHSPPKGTKPPNSARPQRALPGEFCDAKRVCVGESRCVHSFCKCPGKPFFHS